jgi:2-keto-4-pentenoate hydratase/2-oxohepta-3-ene-1,7-dioic acid hydratase in catechol pathway
MRICRIEENESPAAAFYCDTHVVPIAAAARAYAAKTGQRIDLPEADDLLAFLPPDGAAHQAAATLSQWVDAQADDLPDDVRRPVDDVQLLVPVPRPNKLLLLAGNYARHIEESGGIAAERAETFPYLFMKPPSTTLVDPGSPVKIPSVSPDCIDWEMELAVVIGRLAKDIKEADALDYVAGYTIINDISDRRFTPNSDRTTRDKDAFFDWLHGKWHDGFCPCGPCVVSAADVPDPQTLDMRLTVSGELKQQASTAQQIFPVAAVIEFISSFVTLEPGDLISTGTPAGVGDAKSTYLRAGDVLEATIDGIGTLTSPVT